MAQTDGGRTMTFTIPIEVSVRVGSAAGLAGVTDALEAPAGRRLSEGPRLSPEGKKLDRDYANRNGFRNDFVNGVDVDLARIVQPVQARITPLNDDQPNPQRGELKYQNFSVMMDSERRLARITATNIDGDTYKPVDRGTGQVREGETWYIERRIARDAFVDQTFYDGWSHIFDRGHLTRRNDPTWGTAKQAERANADTFHFTNCTPQQWRFNQNIEFWQGIERYVLEKGNFEQNSPKDLTVIQGPVFDDAEDLWADDVQIPSAFWKLVVWRGAHGPRAVALVASQLDLLDEFRRFAGPRPAPDAAVDVSQFRVSIPELEALTQLDLSALRPFDTIAADEAPVVGGEARRRRPLRDWSEIRL